MRRFDSSLLLPATGRSSLCALRRRWFLARGFARSPRRASMCAGCLRKAGWGESQRDPYTSPAGWRRLPTPTASSQQVGERLRRCRAERHRPVRLGMQGSLRLEWRLCIAWWGERTRGGSMACALGGEQGRPSPAAAHRLL
eukprot:scaffold66291_cov32-Tisochrysis_lutea.AAC.1